MSRNAFLITIVLISAGAACAQTPARPAPSPTTQTRSAAPFDLRDFGVHVQHDAPLIIVMAALAAAGFDPTPAGKEPSAFRKLVRKDQEALDPGLRARM